MALKTTNNGAFFNKLSLSPFTGKGSRGKKKKWGGDGEGRKWDSVATMAGVAMGDQLLTLKEVMRGSLCYLGMDKLIQVLYMCEGLYVSVPHSWHCLV